ncbi:unnamed protein product [Haemonchus placei]|uniref:AAA_12 domain-containing protein n=1 Tax=Haemonchus placei TaxID=6290 RepID=A0A0N4WRG0_HAEPC|nr:unnamed protein product [Haemonchus placei]
MEDYVAMAIEGASQNEEYVLSPKFCNFSTIADKSSLNTHDEVLFMLFTAKQTNTQINKLVHHRILLECGVPCTFGLVDLEAVWSKDRVSQVRA